MPRQTTTVRPLRPVRPDAPAPKQRTPRVRRGTGLLLPPQRCPECGTSLAHLVPVPSGAVEAATIVARRALEGEETTSAQVADALGLRPAQASERLHRAAQDGLVRRVKHTLPAGGYRYSYAPRPQVAAVYLPEDGLAAHLRALLATPREEVARVLAGAGRWA